MKKFVSLMLALALVCALALPTFAASGVSSDEQALLNKFNSAVDAKASLIKDAKIVAEYKTEAENALAKVELSKAACDDLSKTIDEVLAFLDSKNVNSRDDVKAILPDVLAKVNATANKYDMTVSVGNDWYAHVTIKGTDVGGNGGSIVKQTGFDTTATFVIVGILAAALVSGVVIVRKEELVSRG